MDKSLDDGKSHKSVRSTNPVALKTCPIIVLIKDGNRTKQYNQWLSNWLFSTVLMMNQCGDIVDDEKM